MPFSIFTMLPPLPSTARLGRLLRYFSSEYGTTVFNPSLPPLSCTTTRIFSPLVSAPKAADSSRNRGARDERAARPPAVTAETVERNLRREVVMGFSLSLDGALRRPPWASYLCHLELRQ